jgi:signal transduction histidine kinase
VLSFIAQPWYTCIKRKRGRKKIRKINIDQGIYLSSFNLPKLLLLLLLLVVVVVVVVVCVCVCMNEKERKRERTTINSMLSKILKSKRPETIPT